jgi:hypothetical protein
MIEQERDYGTDRSKLPQLAAQMQFRDLPDHHA